VSAFLYPLLSNRVRYWFEDAAGVVIEEGDVALRPGSNFFSARIPADLRPPFTFRYEAYDGRAVLSQETER